MKFLNRIILVLVFSSVAIFAQNIAKTGTTSAQFLKIGIGPRAVAMGTAFTATSNDIFAIYWNPAGISDIANSAAAFNHTEWFANIKTDFAAFAINLSDLGTIGAFVNVLSMDEMVVRTIDQPEGTGELFNAGALSAGLTYARNLTDNFSIGFNFKYVKEYIWNESAQAVCFDFGTMYKIPILNEFRLAASISNFGTKMEMDGRDIIEIKQVGAGEGNLINSEIQLEQYDLPLLFRIGVAADLLKISENRITVAIDAVHPNDHYEYINTGFEYSWNEIVFLRGGYKSLFEQDSEEGLTLGMGLEYRLIDAIKLAVDYAYQDFGRLEEVHHLSVGVKF